MLKTRIIPTMLYKDFGLVKGTRFDSRRAVGSAVQAIKVYNLRGVDELVFCDVTATVQGRGPDFELIDDLADDCFMPLTVGGGVTTADDVGRLLRVGADKVSVNTCLVEHPDVVRQAATSFGSQCVVASIDYRGGPDGAGRVWTRSGATETDWRPADLAVRAEELGAGEILLTSIDNDGTMEGYNTDVTREVSDAVTVPVIASGGAGSYEHMRDAIMTGGADAVAAASIFHFTEQTPHEAKLYLDDAGIRVRL